MGNRRPITMELDGEHLDTLKDFCKAAGVPMSLFFSSYLSGLVVAIKAHGWVGKRKLSKLDVLRFAVATSRMPTDSL